MNFLIRNPFQSLGNVELSTLLKVRFIDSHSEIFQIISLNEVVNNSGIAAASEGSIPLEEGEELWLIETDQGDGWTRWKYFKHSQKIFHNSPQSYRVRRLNVSHLDPMPEGFVPTSYIETTQMFDQPQPV